MGLLNDAASVISARSSHSKKSRRKHRSRSRSHSPRRHSSSQAGGMAGQISGIAASIFGGESSSDSDRKRRKKSGSSHAGSFFGTDDYKKHSSSKASFFGIPVGGSSSHSHHRGSPSYYKRSPRPNFVSRVLKKLKRLLRDLVYYAKRHPLKVFMLVIMPLITGGFLTALLAKFGLRLPASLTKMLGIASKAATGDGIGLVARRSAWRAGRGLGRGWRAG